MPLWIVGRRSWLAVRFDLPRCALLSPCWRSVQANTRQAMMLCNGSGHHREEQCTIASFSPFALENTLGHAFCLCCDHKPARILPQAETALAVQQ